MIEQEQRPRFSTSHKVGSRSVAFAVSLVLYSAIGFGVVRLSHSEAARMRPARSQTILLQEGEAFAPPPPPAGSAPSAKAGPTSLKQEMPMPIETPENLPTETIQPSPLPESIGPAPSGQGVGQPDGFARGMPGGVKGGIAGGVPGGQVGSTLVPPRFDAAYLQNPPPDYPGLSKRLGEEGKVILRVLVSPEGRAQSLEIRASSGFPRLDQAALETVRRWRFLPARQGETPMAAWVLVPITFQFEV